MIVREHIASKLMNLAHSGLTVFKTSDIQELSYVGKEEFGKYLGSPGSYTREFRRMRTDGILKVRKLDRKNRQQVWALHEVQTSFPNDVI